ncbi:MAG: F0F1 ATP synthase subunit A [Dehalococcoidia bacterium]|nr:F0F1 ATP synthase subunit A [Dehalococcoidia bacterium]
MPRFGRKTKVIIAVLIVLSLMLISGLFFPLPPPDIHLAANYGDGSPDPFFSFGPIRASNTLIASWLTIIVLGAFFFVATRKMSLVPRGVQNFAEMVIEGMYSFVERIAGENAKRFFPVVGTIFLYVLFNAWLSLLPIFNVIGRYHIGTADTLFFGQYSGPIIEVPLLRGANTDINIPLMLALVSFIAVEYWGLSALGWRTYLGKFARFRRILLGFSQLVKGKLKAAAGSFASGFVDAFVGALEALSEFIRIISFTARLFGNMTAGELLVLIIAFIIPWLIAVPFYGLETLLGVIQALIFGTLTLVFATFAVARPEEDH